MSFNRFLVKLGMDPCFHYLISGGDQSLVISNELPEDDPFQGIFDHLILLAWDNKMKD